MSYADGFEAISTQFQTGFFGDYPDSLADLQNLGLTDANGDQTDGDGAPWERPLPNPDDVAGSTWVRETVLFGGTRSDTLGGVDRTIGLAVYSVFVPAVGGITYAHQVADKIRSYFRLQSFSGVHCIAGDGAGPSMRDVGPTPDGWYQVNVSAPFQYVEDAVSAEVLPLTQNRLSVTQSANGFAVRDWVVKRISGSWEKAQATAAVHAEEGKVLGLVVRLLTADRFEVVIGDAVTITAHGWTVGPLWVSQATPGAVTSTEPSLGEVSWLAAAATTANDLVVFQRASKQL